MRKFLGNVLAALVGFMIGGLFLMLIAFAVIGSIASKGEKKPAKVSKDSVLELDLKGELVERESDDPFLKLASFSSDEGQPLGLNRLVAGLHKAKKDDKIKGIHLRMGMMGGGMASVESLRKALIDFKSSGKFIIASADFMTEKTYYLASVADKVCLYPTGMIEWNGLASTPMFLRGMLDKLEVKPMVFKVGQFKSAAEMFSEKQMSEPNRRQIQTMLDDFWGHMLEGIASSRKLDRAAIDRLASELTVIDGKGAKKHKLIDELWHGDEVEADLKSRLKIEGDEKLRSVKFSDYAERESNEKSGGKKIAVLYAVGEIGMGKGGDDSIGSEGLSEQIRKAREDDDIKAVVLRVNSPGGSALASDIIAREIELTRKVKPVVASYGDVAASGGYYISALCDSIIAEPTTITGSIGVIGMMANTQQFFNNKLGITFDRVYSHDNQYADLGNTNRAMSEFEQAKIQRGVEDIYSDFIHVVMRGRGYADSVAVDSIAQGRVWSGTRAKSLKLIDGLGSLNDAIAIAARKAALAEGDYEIVNLPESEPFLTRLLKGMEASLKANVLNDYLTAEQQQLVRVLRSIQEPKGIFMREFMDFDIN